MNIKEIREKSSEDLKKTLDEMKVELFDLRLKVSCKRPAVQVVTSGWLCL